MSFRKMMLTALACVMALSMCSCSAERPDSYYMELTVKTGGAPSVQIKADEELTEPIYLGLDTEWSLSFDAHIDLRNSRTGRFEFSLLAQPEMSDQIGFHIAGYLVDSEGNYVLDSAGNKISSVPADSIFNYNVHAYSGRVSILNRAGIYKMEATVPALPRYGLQASSFHFFVTVGEDTREDAVEIVMDDSVSYEKIESDPFGDREDRYDIYYCQNRPKFRARLKSDGEILPDNDVLPTFRKLDDLYFYNVPKLSYNELTGSGIYLCCIHYRGTEQYRALNYYCYVIYT